MRSSPALAWVWIWCLRHRDRPGGGGFDTADTAMGDCPLLAKTEDADPPLALMLGDSAAIMLTGVLLTVINQGDYVILGIFTNVAATGLYFFAFQPVDANHTLVTVNLVSVLFPALAKLQLEPKRQTQAFIKASQSLAIAAIPLCILQAALADPAGPVDF